MNTSTICGLVSAISIRVCMKCDLCATECKSVLLDNSSTTMNLMFWSAVNVKQKTGSVCSTFAIRYSPFNGKCQSLTFDVWSYLAIKIQLFILWRGRVMMDFLGGQRYFVRNNSNSKWNASCVEGICQAVLPDIPEPSCSSFGRGKVMIRFFRRARPFCAYKKWFDMDCSLWSSNKSPFIAEHSLRR